MSDKGPIEQIKELAPQASLEVDLAVASHNAAVLRHKIEELESKLQNQTHLIEQLFVMLDKTEETDDGIVFHPNQLRSCRATDTEKLNKILKELKGKDQ
jgi:hypothetical protein